MKRIQTILIILSMAIIAQAQVLFQPYKHTALRLPSVPIIVNDPYFSIWSPYDRLTDGSTRHWTNAEKPIDGLLRVDGKVYQFMGKEGDIPQIETAKQKSVSVLATSTFYSFTCGDVSLDLVFTAPMLINDLDLISMPINYISYQVRSLDGQKHKIQLYLGVSSWIAVNQLNQPTESSIVVKDGTRYLKSGTIDQPILAKKGDGICIDWGYVYMPECNGTVCLTEGQSAISNFIQKGKFPESRSRIINRDSKHATTLAYMHDFGQVDHASSFTMLGYDEIQDIEYMYVRYKAYWARNGKDIFQAFRYMQEHYKNIMELCQKFDKMIYDDGFKSGNVEYAEILSGSYRQVMAAHKLFLDKDGNLLFFSKENNSNGCVNTVDLTYPSSPLFLVYNPELVKGMMTSIFNYSQSGRWIKPFACHDQGTYPIANGQVYGGDMPIEEAGNMVILSAMISKIENSTHYVDPYWDILKTWTDYLVTHGEDPANQLCTDDFAGHWAHNCNLSIKAIMGIAGFSEMAKLKGNMNEANKYRQIAKDMAVKWEKKAKDGDHYRLAFDKDNTWSQKYNMVWDALWNLNLFPNHAMQHEIKYYLSKQNIYGIPLDCRKTYTKSDWIMWTAAMAKDKKTFLKFVSPIYKYINETPSRVPISDWSETISGKMVGFKARSVIGGYWMKVLADKLKNKEYE